MFITYNTSSLTVPPIASVTNNNTVLYCATAPTSFTNTDPYIVECGQTLTSISDWPMGQCGNRATSDPRIFGPEAWRTFHRFAQNYPSEPDSTTQQACRNFLNAIPYMLPCGHCGYDFAEFIQTNEEHEGSDPYFAGCGGSEEYNMPCQGPVTACLNQSNLVNFFLRAHHNVDVLTKPCKPLWSPQQAQEAYEYQQDFCATGIVYGTSPICKEEGETECARVNLVSPKPTI